MNALNKEIAVAPASIHNNNNLDESNWFSSEENLDFFGNDFDFDAELPDLLASTFNLEGEIAFNGGVFHSSQEFATHSQFTFIKTEAQDNFKNSQHQKNKFQGVEIKSEFSSEANEFSQSAPLPNLSSRSRKRGADLEDNASIKSHSTFSDMKGYSEADTCSNYSDAEPIANVTMRTVNSPDSLYLPSSTQPRYSFIENRALVQAYFALQVKQVFHGTLVDADVLKDLYLKNLAAIAPGTEYPPRESTALVRHFKALKSKNTDMMKFIDKKFEFGSILDMLDNIVAIEAAISKRKNEATQETTKRRKI